jgi:hypothetical protein
LSRTFSIALPKLIFRQDGIQCENRLLMTTFRAFFSFGDFFNAELKAGVYKTLPNNPKRNGSVHEYCPPEHVASEIDRLVALHAEHLQRGLPAEVQAACHAPVAC